MGAVDQQETPFIHPATRIRTGGVELRGWVESLVPPHSEKFLRIFSSTFAQPFALSLPAPSTKPIESAPMTARTASPLDKNGTGRGKKVVTKPITKKRGASVNDPKRGAGLREKFSGQNLANIPTAQVAELADPNKPLTDKAKLFVKFWAEGNSITTASTMAGYGDGASYAYKVARLPQAIALYNEEKAKFEAAGDMSRRQVMDMLKEAYDMAKLVSEPSSMVSAAREIGKICGYYEPVKVNLKISGEVGVVQRKMDNMSDAELLKMIADGGPGAVQQAVETAKRLAIEHDEGDVTDVDPRE